MRMIVYASLLVNNIKRKMATGRRFHHEGINYANGRLIRLIFLISILLLIGFLYKSNDVRGIPTFRVVFRKSQTDGYYTTISEPFHKNPAKMDIDKNDVAKSLHDIFKKRPFRCRYLMEGTMLFYYLAKRVGLNFTVNHLQADEVHADKMCSKKVMDYWVQNMSEVAGKFGSSVTQARSSSSQPNAVLDHLCSYNVKVLRAPDLAYPRTVTYELTESPSPGSSQTGTGPVPGRRACTTGGTTFKLMTSGRATRSFCNTLSYFNGTYLVTCSVHESSSRLSVYRIGMDFTAFSLAFPRRRLVHSGLMPDPLLTHTSLDQNASKCERIGRLYPQHPGYWRRATGDAHEYWSLEGGRWEFMVDGCPLTPMTRAHLTRCLEDVNNLLFMGDSHMRLVFLHTLLKLNQTESDVPWRFLSVHLSTNQLMFRLNNNAFDISQDLTNLSALLYQHKTDPDKPQVLIINAGLADLETNSIIGYVTGFESLFSVLAEFLKHPKKYRIIWMGTTPVPDDSIENNQEIMALNGWLYDRLTQLGVEIFDTFPIVYPFNNACIWDKHCMFIDPSDQKVKGDIGLAYTEMLLHFICR